MTLCVIKLMGSGQDCIFMGVVRPTISEDPKTVKVREYFLGCPLFLSPICIAGYCKLANWLNGIASE